jgi:hypothetical protein
LDPPALVSVSVSAMGSAKTLASELAFPELKPLAARTQCRRLHRRKKSV